MKCLFVTPTSTDHLASCLWDGLQEVLGEDKVVDALGCPWLHTSTALQACARAKPGERNLSSDLVLHSIGASRQGKMMTSEKKEFDLMVVHSSINRDRDWDWVRALRAYLKDGGKVAYVEGWDAAWQIVPPEMRVDATFRKEISSQVAYPYQPHHLTFAAPSRWFLPTGERRYDVSFIGNPDSIHPNAPHLRWDMLARTFMTRRRHKSVIATTGIGFELYFDVLRHSKLALCPAAADSADSLRTYEVAACGAIPVFVGYPPYRREEWFTGEHAIFCEVETLTQHLDEVLTWDLNPMLARLQAHALKHHTTKARALKVLDVLGFKKGVDF